MAIAEAYSWRWAYVGELIFFVPLIVAVAIVSCYQTGFVQEPPNSASRARASSGASERWWEPVVHDLKTLVTNLSYWLIVLGFSQMLAVYSGAATLASTIFLALGLTTSARTAVIVISVQGLLAGAIGAVCGGALVDVASKQETAAHAAVAASEAAGGEKSAGHAATVLRAAVATRTSAALSLGIMVASAAIGLAVFMIAAAIALLDHGVYGYVACTSFGIAAVMLAFPSIQFATMLAVPRRLRALALGFCQIIVHFMGDVPASPLVGMLLDKLAPKACSSCDAPPDGVQRTILIVYAWTIIPVVLWSAALLRALWQRRKLRAKLAAAL